MKLVLKDLNVGYQESLVSRLSISLSMGKVHILLGDNGLGKTTLLKTIAGILKPISGQVEVLSSERQGVALVTTDKPQIDFLSVREYLSFGESQGSETITNSLLEDFSATEFVNMDVSELSDGQFKKISLIRQLLKEKAVLLLDEPSAYLDIKNKDFLSKMLGELKKSQVVLLSTHDVDFARSCGDVFYKISDGELLQDVDL